MSMKKKDITPIEFVEKSSKKVGLLIPRGAMEILMCVPPKEKGSQKTLRRLIRIRKNVFRELEALNKELRRHTKNEVFA